MTDAAGNPWCGLVRSVFLIFGHSSLSSQLSWNHSKAHSRFVIASAEERAPQKSPRRFFREAPKIYEMCLHVPLCKRGCRGGIARTEKALGTHAFSLWESTLFRNNWRWIFFFLFTFATNRQALCRIVFSEKKLVFPPMPSSFLSPFCTAGWETDRSDCGSPPLCSDLLW